MPNVHKFRPSFTLAAPGFVPRRATVTTEIAPFLQAATVQR